MSYDRTYLVEKVDLVDVALVHKHAQILPRRIHVHALQLPRLVLGSLVTVQAQVPQSSKLRRLVGIPVSHKELDLGCDLALVGENLHLQPASIQSACRAMSCRYVATFKKGKRSLMLQMIVRREVGQ